MVADTVTQECSISSLCIHISGLFADSSSRPPLFLLFCQMSNLTLDQWSWHQILTFLHSSGTHVCALLLHVWILTFFCCRYFFGCPVSSSFIDACDFRFGCSFSLSMILLSNCLLPLEMFHIDDLLAFQNASVAFKLNCLRILEHLHLFLYTKEHFTHFLFFFFNF